MKMRCCCCFTAKQFKQLSAVFSYECELYIFWCLKLGFYVSIENTSSIALSEWIESYRQYFKCYPIQCRIKLFVYHFSLFPADVVVVVVFSPISIRCHLPHQKKRIKTKIGCFCKIGKLKSESQHLIGIFISSIFVANIHALHTLASSSLSVCDTREWKSIMCVFFLVHVGSCIHNFQQWQYSTSLRRQTF